MYYTTIEQSKKLLELGLSPDSADMLYTWDTDNKTYYPLPIIDDKEHDFPTGLSCWSLDALLSVMPKIDGFKPIIDLDINSIRYEGEKRDESFHSASTLIDACYEMVVWLLQNNYFNK